MGERTPHLDSNARGALVGVTASHTRAHIVRAILEGVAFSLRDTFTLFREMNVPVASIRLGGGGACSPLWRQIQAGRSMAKPSKSSKPKKAPHTGRPSRWRWRGFWPTVDVACAATVRIASRIASPTCRRRHPYASYAAYRRIYPATREILGIH